MRIYHHYTLWECYKCGFYDNLSGKERDLKIQSSIKLFNSILLTEKYMDMVINLWPNSCEHFLSNPSMNKIAYIGQSACCIYDQVPNLVTMEAWKLLDESIKTRSDKIATRTILKWRQKKRLENTFSDGAQKDTKTGFQMRLRFN